MKVCSIKECVGKSVKRGMCSTHWKRWQRGDYTIEIKTKIKGSFDVKFQKYTKRHDNGCLIWTGPMSDGGYGRIGYKGKRIKAHRAVYDHFIGIKKHTNHIHHKCGNKSCVEISHLEELSHFFHLKEHKRDSLGRLLPAHSSS